MKEDIEIKLMTAPLQNLRQTALDINKYAFSTKWRWYYSARSDYSWVLGISEVEITDFIRIYDSTKDDIKNTIDTTDNNTIKNTLYKEYRLLPALCINDFIHDKDNLIIMILNSIRLIKKIRLTLKFRDIIGKIIDSCDNMINCIENSDWYELEKSIK
jgi:hypothetical protein